MNGTNQEPVASWRTSFYYYSLLDVALAFDSDTNRLYFHDGQEILYTNADQMDGYVYTVSLPSWINPKGLAVKESYLYWGDWTNMAVYRVNKTSLKNRKKVMIGVDPMDLHVYHNNSDTPGKNDTRQTSGAGCTKPV